MKQRGQKHAVVDTTAWLELKPRVRDLPRESTPAEAKLWQAIRSKRLGVNFERQCRYERYVVEFFCLEGLLTIEVEGMPSLRGPAEDARRQANLEALGVRFLRFRDDDVMSRLPRVLATIRAALNLTDVADCP